MGVGGHLGAAPAHRASALAARDGARSWPWACSPTSRRCWCSLVLACARCSAGSPTAARGSGCAPAVRGHWRPRWRWARWARSSASTTSPRSPRSSSSRRPASRSPTTSPARCSARRCPSALLGGPWRWDTGNPPTSYADPPAWTVRRAWVVLRRWPSPWLRPLRRAHRPGLAAAGAATPRVAFVLLLTSRARSSAASIGLEYRYLTDVAAGRRCCAWGWPRTPRRSAPASSSEPRAVPPLLGPRRTPVRSSPRWSRRCWRGGRAQLGDLRPDLARRQPRRRLPATRPERCADQGAGRPGRPGGAAARSCRATRSPYNTTERLLPLQVGHGLRFPDGHRRAWSSSTTDGHATGPRSTSPSTAPPGPDGGLRLADRPAPVTHRPADGTAFDRTWWVQPPASARRRRTTRWR